LPVELPERLSLPDGFSAPRIALPGVLMVQGPPCASSGHSQSAQMESFCSAFQPNDQINVFPLIVVADDSDFTTASLNNFLWVAFTRSNPAADIHGIGSFFQQKHWGCEGALVIDARIKPHHAPPLLEDPAVTRRVDALGAPGGPLHGII